MKTKTLGLNADVLRGGCDSGCCRSIGLKVSTGDHAKPLDEDLGEVGLIEVMRMTADLMEAKLPATMKNRNRTVQ